MGIERDRKKELPEGMKRLLDRDRGERQPQALATPPAPADVWAELETYYCGEASEQQATLFSFQPPGLWLREHLRGCTFITELPPKTQTALPPFQTRDGDAPEASCGRRQSGPTGRRGVVRAGGAWEPAQDLVASELRKGGRLQNENDKAERFQIGGGV
jgi:hypothetical protein